MDSSRTSFALALALTAFMLAAPASGEEWPGFRGDGSGVARTLAAGEGPVSLSLRWKQPLGSGYAGLSVAEGSLVTVARDGEDDVVVALDPASGEERWRTRLGPAYIGHDGSADGGIATPAIAGGRVFALGPWGDLAAFDLETGASLWSLHLTEDLGCEKPLYGFGSSPLVVDDTMVLQIGGAEGAVAGFDVATGALRWRVVDDEVGSESPILTELAGRRQVVALCVRTLVGLDPADGTVLWSLDHGAGSNNIMGSETASPLPLGDDLLLVKHETTSTLVVRVEPTEEGFSATPVHEVRLLNRSYSPPTRWGDRVYGFTSRFLSSLDPRSGEMVWRSRDPGDGFVVSAEGRLAILTKDGSLYLGDVGPEGWREAAHLDLFEDLAWTPPSIADGALFARSLGEIARVDLVRDEPAVLEADAPAVPAALEPLVAALETAPDREAAVSGFLSERSVPLVDGEEVVFLWHGPASDVAVAGEMIGARREEKMHRLEGTDLWWWATSLDRRARVGYLFFVDYEPARDPLSERHAVSTILGPDMNWLLSDEPMPLSWLAMPEWPGLETPADPAPTSHGRLESFTLSVQPPGGAAEAVDVPINAWLPPGYDADDRRYPVAFVHDPWVRELGGWPETLDRVVGRSVAPLIVVFVESDGFRGYTTVFADQIVPAVDERLRTLADREARANVGMGFGSIPAAIVAVRHRDRFGRLGVQSFFGLEAEFAVLREALAAAEDTASPSTAYIEWGRWDLRNPHEGWDARVLGVQLDVFLREQGWQTTGGEVWDGTDVGSWRNRADVLLETLFPLEGGRRPGPTLADWLTGAPAASQ